MSPSDRLVTNFRDWRAVVLHRPGSAADAILRQLERLGLTSELAWPELGEGAALADVIFFDVDMGYDEQFPWAAGHAPMPLVALIGSEAPGRIGWALSHNPAAHLLKPLSSAGVFSALQIARHAFAKRQALEAQVDGLVERLQQRPAVARALVRLMREGCGEDEAMRRLRRFAMDRQLTLEAAAELYLSTPDGGAAHGAR